MKNEALYAESVREMLELNSYIIPYYNYEPRLHKPPLTYWSIILSTKVFGLNEFGIRFPMFIFALLSLFFTYKIATLIFNKTVAYFSFLALSFSPMFIGNARYTAPEMPLLFFFTASLYFFLKGYITNKHIYFILFYIFVGLTVITKGYPFYIIIGFILFIFLVIETKGSLKEFLKKLKQIHLPAGIVISILIGGWWYLYAFLDQGVWLIKEVLRETIDRATDYDSFFKQLKPLFYLKILLWAFLPYVGIAILGIFIALKKDLRKFRFFLAWIGGMYLIFTFSAEKIPNYFLQAFPALSVLAGYTVMKIKNENSDVIWKILFTTVLIIPSVYVAIYLFYGIIKLNLSHFYIIFTIVGALTLLLLKKVIYLPVFITASFYVFLVTVITPIVEKYRPYKEIGKIILQKVPDKTVPIFVEDKSLNNLTFYAQRKLYGKMSIQQIKKHRIPYIAIIYEKNINKFENFDRLWCGYIYKNRGDSRILTLLKYVIKAENGDMSGFDKMCVIYKKGERNGRNNNP